MSARLGLSTLVLFSFLGTFLSGAADIPALVRQAKPAVVQIVTFDQENKPLKTGTGFFISADGNLLTNYHVISNASSILAKTPSGAVYFLKGIVSVSPPTDVALLQFYASDVPYLRLGSTIDAVEGQRVLVIGNPEGLEGTVSDGIISAFRENRSMIQITAPISSGSSGSPVLDESGQVLGIATLIFKEGQNLNFAISAEAIRDAITKSAVARSTPTPTRSKTTIPTPSPNVAAVPTPTFPGLAEDTNTKKKLVVGFSEVGAKSGWHTAQAESIKSEAAKRGIDLRFSDAQQKQANQIDGA